VSRKSTLLSKRMSSAPSSMIFKMKHLLFISSLMMTISSGGVHAADGDIVEDNVEPTIYTDIVSDNAEPTIYTDIFELTPTMAPTTMAPQENTATGRASTAKPSCSCRKNHIDTTDVIRARINNNEGPPPCEEDLALEGDSEVEGAAALFSDNTLSLSEYESLYGNNNTTTDTVIIDANKSIANNDSMTPGERTIICLSVTVFLLILLLFCNYQFYKIQKQRQQEELCGQYLYDIPDSSGSDDDDDSRMLADGEIEYPIHKVVSNKSHGSEGSTRFGIRRQLSKLVDYVVSIRTTRSGKQSDILTDVHRCTSAFCPVCEKQRRAVMSFESYDIQAAGKEKEKQEVGEGGDEDGSIIYVPRGDEENGPEYIYETDNDNDGNGNNEERICLRYKHRTVFKSPTTTLQK